MYNFRLQSIYQTECKRISTVSLCAFTCREGSIPDIIACGSLHEFLCKAHKQYGPIISLWLGPKLCVSIGSAKLFAQQENVFNRGCKFKRIIVSSLN